jgi:integrase
MASLVPFVVQTIIVSGPLSGGQITVGNVVALDPGGFWRDLLSLVARRRIGRVNASVSREIEVWRAVWRWAAKARYDIGEMPDWGALMLKVPATIPRELSAVEESGLFTEIRTDLFDFCEFALRTGWRKSEVIGLRWSDVDLGARSAATKIKGGDIVRRPLTQDMLVIIANQPKVGPFVFTCVAARTKPAFVDKLGRKHPARKKGRPLSDDRDGAAQAMGGRTKGRGD